MGKYGNAAIKAVNLVKSGSVKSPINAWERATSEIFGEGTSSQDKGCPRGAFLGLCEEGIITGIPAGNYTRSIKNKEYALKAIRLLKEGPEITQTELWGKVVESEGIKHNEQMDVVISLWKNGLIKF
jgi:hypothetical protein